MASLVFATSSSIGILSSCCAMGVSIAGCSELSVCDSIRGDSTTDSSVVGISTGFVSISAPASPVAVSARVLATFTPREV